VVDGVIVSSMVADLIDRAPVDQPRAALLSRVAELKTATQPVVAWTRARQWRR
jgi:hypothetical protein